MVSELTSPNESDSFTNVLAPGEMLGARYRLTQKLGSGAFGQVFAAEDTHQNRRVALKILRANARARDPDALARLRQEAEILDALEHPNIVDIYAVEDSPEGVFMVMELLEGKSIDQLLVAEGPGAPERVARAAHQLLSALIASHARGVLHRDLKPENIILTQSQDPDDEQAKLLDFGIAKAHDILDDTNEDGVTLVKTRGGGFLGTPRYCAPEIVVGDPAEPSADIFSLGLVLAEWLTGKERIDAHKQSQALAILLRPEPLDVSDCPSNWQAWLAKMIAKNPTERYPSAELAMGEFERLVQGSADAAQPPDSAADSAQILEAAAFPAGAWQGADFVSDTADTYVREVPNFDDYQPPRANPPAPMIYPTPATRSPSPLKRTSAPQIPAPSPPKPAPAGNGALYFVAVALGTCVLFLLLIFLWQSFSG